MTWRCAYLGHPQGFPTSGAKSPAYPGRSSRPPIISNAPESPSIPVIWHATHSWGIRISPAGTALSLENGKTGDKTSVPLDHAFESNSGELIVENSA